MKRILLLTLFVLLVSITDKTLAQSCNPPTITGTVAQNSMWQVNFQGTRFDSLWQAVIVLKGSDPNNMLNWISWNTLLYYGDTSGLGYVNYFTSLPPNVTCDAYVRAICHPGDTSLWSNSYPITYFPQAPVFNVTATVYPNEIFVMWSGNGSPCGVYRFDYETGTEHYIYTSYGTPGFPDNTVTPGWHYYKVVDSMSGKFAVSDWVEYSLCAASFSFENWGMDSVNFYNSTNNANIFHWDFGDGTVSEKDTISQMHYFAKPGIYHVCLYAKNDSTGCSSQICQDVPSRPGLKQITPAFTYYPDQEIEMIINFYNNTPGNLLDYYWTFGDGKISKEVQPTHPYSIAGYYEVCLTATEQGTGVNGTTCEKIQVGTPACNMSADFSYQIADTTVQLFNRSTGNIQFYYWYFDDGTVSVDKDPVHGFSKGEHYVSCTVSDTNWLCTDTREQYIQVGTVDCKAAFDYSVGADNKTVTFSNTSSGNIVYYYWYFGDGNYSKEENPVQPFSQGKYLVTLVVENADGSCMDYAEKEIQVGEINCSAQFSYIVDIPAKTVYCKNKAIGENTKYYWYFGDGSSSNEADPPHEFKYPGYYTIGLNTFDSVTWCMDYFETKILVGDETSDCEADFFYKVDPDSLKVRFNDKSIGKINNYVWDFGDGVISKLKDPEHDYPYGGYFDVCLSVVNDAGISNINCKWIEVAPDIKTNCYADFNYDINPKSKLVTLVNKSLGDPVSFDWDLGDGSTSKQKDSLEHTYTSDDYYLVTLHITTAAGCESFGYKLINIGQPDGIFAKFGYNPKHYNAKAGGYPVDFGGAGLGDNSRLRWNFGDGSTYSTNMTPSHLYTSPGQYYVCLTVADTVTHQDTTECEYISTQTKCQNDSIDPVAKCKNISIVVVGTYTDISEMEIDNSSTDDCGIASYSLDNKRFYPENLGDNATQLTVTDFGGNTSTCTAIVTVTAVIEGINSTSVNKTNLTVSPNPVRNIIKVEFKLPVNCTTELVIYDLLGKQVAVIGVLKLNSGNQNITYNASALKSGSYILQLKTSTGIIDRQVIIKQ